MPRARLSPTVLGLGFDVHDIILLKGEGEQSRQGQQQDAGFL